MLGFFLVFFAGQFFVGLHEHNHERQKRHQTELSVAEYLQSPHFVEATAENWESEFLQMFVYVVGTAFLYQKGSAESKDPRKRHGAGAARAVTLDSPWPVRRGGWILRVYRHSLSLALLVLFVVAWSLHLCGGHRLFNEERIAEGQPPLPLADYLTSPRFWFESFQNWQSEFLAIGCMVVLSIWLREANSPESKQVATPHGENEE